MMVGGDAVHGDGDWDGEAAELELSEDESLPWLETDEYDEDAGAVDTARIIGFAALLLLLLALIIGGLWWLTNRNDGANAVADGSTIEAPDGDYKERPDDAGGKEFAGTGTVAPAVGQGETREGTISDGAAEGSQGIEDSPAAGAGADFTNNGGNTSGGSAQAGSANAGNGSATASSGGVGVQVGAFGSEARAKEGWAQLKRQTTALNGVRYRVVKGTADIGTVYRLQAVSGSAAAANQLCSKLKADGLACQVKR